jgi:predicted transcriptional regulator
MATATVRINKKTHDMLREIAGHENHPMQAVIEAAVEGYRRRQLLENANAAYARQKADPKAWRRARQERLAWDATLSDGLKKE